jgi:hypothetical protein
MAKKRRKLRMTAERAKDRELDLQVSRIARVIAHLEQTGVEVFLILPLQLARDIGALAMKRERQCREN